MNIINHRISSFLQKDSDERQAIWDDAVKLFHQGQFHDSIKKLALYLDPSIELREENGKTKFELKQGSVTLFCRFTEESVYAYINVLAIEYHDPIVYRRLLNLNSSEFQNCKASIVKNYIRLSTESLLELASPTRIYWDLHELSTHGDKLDDILSIYSKGVSETEQVSHEEWSNEQIERSYNFFHKWIDQALIKSEFWYRKNDLYVASWWLLGRLYSILYFVQPEGKLQEEIWEIINDYSNDDRSHDENIKRLIIRLQKLKRLSKKEVIRDFYSSSYIFQTQKPITRSMLVKYLDSSLNSADRFKTLGHKESEYIALVYGLGLVISNFMLDDDFLKELIEAYEMAHVDFILQADANRIRKYYRNGENRSMKQLSLFASKENIPKGLESEADLSIVIKKLRHFYSSILDGEI